jgi:polymorphic toxin system nucleotidyltransferase-like protein
MKATQQRFSAALDALIDQVKKDRSILAAILWGSLSHDVVWEKSDIDLLLVTIDDRKVEESDVPLYADGVNVHVNLTPRAAFRKAIDGSLHNSFVHSMLAKGRLLYTHDETIADLCQRLNEIGAHDTELRLLQAATHALPSIYKAHKWFITRGDLDYTALWILYAATALAQIEVISHRQIADREVIPHALKLNPAFFNLIYTDLLNAKKTRTAVQQALDAVDGYIAERAPTLFAKIFEHLKEVGEARSAREIDNHFSRHFNVEHVTIACEYLADQHLLGKASLPVRLTKKSNIDVQELAFFWQG